MTTNTTSVSSVSGRKRRRPAVVCNECRRRKIACDRHTPCGQCVQHKSACTYSTHSHSPSDERRTGRRTWPGPAPPPHSNSNSDTSVPSAPLSAASNLEISAILQPSVGIHGNAALRPAYAVGSRDVNAIRVAPAGLQQSVTGPTVNGINLQNLNVRSNVNGPDRSADTSAEAASSPPAVVAHARHRLNGRVDKARLFGQSHWMNSLLQFEEICKFKTGDLFNKSSESYLLLDRCKQLARAVKARRPTPQSIPRDCREYVPPRQVCDQLVQLYLRTYETVFRVLHVPSFEQEYIKYWDNPPAANEAFVVKLLLVLAIGTCFYEQPDSQEVSLHSASSDWIYAAYMWLCAPFGKRRMDLTGIQIQCLFLLAAETNGDNGDLMLINTSLLVRTAMSVGLHRDPIHFPNVSVLEAEIRRRLWATILEIVVQSSLDSGMPPFISCDDFDCDPPSNLDDIQINEFTKSLPASKPIGTFTQSSTQCALMRSLPTRLKVAKALNELHSDLTYENVVRIGADLTDMCRSNSRLFQSFLSVSPPINQAKPTPFQIKLLDILVRRFLLSLHTPFAHKAFSNVTYYFSRRVCLESSLLLLSYTPFPTIPNTHLNFQDDYTRLSIRGRGMYKSMLLHATSAIFFELNVELRDDSSPSTSSLSLNDLYAAAQDSIRTTHRRIIAGETNVKGHVFFSCELAQIDAMRAGTSVETAVGEAAKRSLEACYAVLKTRAERMGVVEKGDEVREGRRVESENATMDEAALVEFAMNNDLGLNFDFTDNWLLSGSWDDNDFWT